MISKPIITINSFGGMSDKGGMYYMEGFSISNLSIDENYAIEEVLNPTSTPNLSKVNAMAHLQPLKGSTMPPYTLLSDGMNFYANKHKVGELNTSGDYKYSRAIDLFQLPSGNIFFTSNRYLNLIVRGVCKTTSTTKIVDEQGRSFTSLGLGTSAPNNRVANVRTGEIYTITSISTTNSSNDTLNFSSGAECEAGDEFMALSYKYKDLNDGITIPTFAGQQEQEYWNRPIQLYGDQYMFGNGNYIGVVANDEKTIDTKYKILPSGYQLIDFKTNSFDNILVSAVDNQGMGHLLLWDGTSDGWQQILDLDTAPTAVIGSGSGWIYLLNGKIYYTDGLNIRELVGFPNTTINTTGFNAIAFHSGTYYFGIEAIEHDRAINGVLVFDPNGGLYLFKTYSDGKAFRKPYCLRINPNTKMKQVYSTNPILEVAGDTFHNKVLFNKSSEMGHKSFIYLINLGQEQQVKEAWLNIKRNTKTNLLDRKYSNTKITVNYGNNPITCYGKAEVVSETKVENKNGDIYPAKAGSEIEFLTGDLAGQRTYIKSIENGGTTDEEWEIEVVEGLGEVEYREYGLVKAETKELTLKDLDKPTRFLTNFIGDKLWLEVVVSGVEDSFPVSVNSIMLF